jgi:hypothetical protein
VRNKTKLKASLLLFPEPTLIFSLFWIMRHNRRRDTKIERYGRGGNREAVTDSGLEMETRTESQRKNFLSFCQRQFSPGSDPD